MATKNWGCWSMSVCFGFAFSFAVMHLVFVSSTIIHLNLNSVPFNFNFVSKGFDNLIFG